MLILVSMSCKIKMVRNHLQTRLWLMKMKDKKSLHIKVELGHHLLSWYYISAPNIVNHFSNEDRRIVTGFTCVDVLKFDTFILLPYLSKLTCILKSRKWFWPSFPEPEIMKRICLVYRDGTWKLIRMAHSSLGFTYCTTDMTSDWFYTDGEPKRISSTRQKGS